MKTQNTITGLVRGLSSKATNRLVSGRGKYLFRQTNVYGVSTYPGFSSISPEERGQEFHEEVATLLRRGQVSKWTSFTPYACAVQWLLGEIGYTRFTTEKEVRASGYSGRIDVVAYGCGGRKAVVEVKSSFSPPFSPRDNHLVQAALGGYLWNPPGKTGLIVIYVDLRRGSVKSFLWNDFRKVCFRPWELGRN